MTQIEAFSDTNLNSVPNSVSFSLLYNVLFGGAHSQGSVISHIGPKEIDLVIKLH